MFMASCDLTVITTGITKQKCIILIESDYKLSISRYPAIILWLCKASYVNFVCTVYVHKHAGMHLCVYV